jgi:hypothetical protein
MTLAMWTYPWDIADLGIETVERDVVERAGLDTLSFAASYHAGHFLQPRSPSRKVIFPEDGTIYFKPDPVRWDGLRIQPKVAELVEHGEDILAKLIHRRDAGGAKVSAWTVCLHNTRLGTLHPAAVTRNAFGDANLYGLCPSSPDARAYVRALAADLSHHYGVDRIELETVGFMGFNHGFHHEKDGVGLTAEDDFLLSLCFCENCAIRAKRAGIDIGAARSTARTWLCEAFERDVPRARFADFPSRGIDTFHAHPEIYEFVAWRTEPVTSLVAEIRAATAPSCQVVVIDGADGWLGACDLTACSQACDGMIICAYDQSATATGTMLQAVRRQIGADRIVGTGFRLFYPEMSSPEDLAAKVAAARAAGVDSINFYNYGLVPAARLDWVRAALSC